MAARRSASPVKGSQLFAAAVSRLAAVTPTASGGSGRSVSRFSMRSTRHPDSPAAGSSAAAATWSIPNPRIGSMRFALRITGASLIPIARRLGCWAMNRYDWLLFLHVLAAFSLVAALVIVTFLAFIGRRLDRPSEIVRMFRVSRVSDILFAVGSIGTIVLGIILAI